VSAALQLRQINRTRAKSAALLAIRALAEAGFVIVKAEESIP
jgi:hypothetical protein